MSLFLFFDRFFEFWLLTHVALQNLPGESDPSKCKWSSILGSLATNSMSFSSISIFDDDMTWSYDDVWNNNRFTIHWFSEKSISWSVDGVGLLFFEVSSARARSKQASSSTVEILQALHTVSFNWFLSGLEWILNFMFCLLKWIHYVHQICSKILRGTRVIIFILWYLQKYWIIMYEWSMVYVAVSTFDF